MAELFDRFWKLRVKDRQGRFDFEVAPDEFGNTLRIQFEINVSTNIRYYTGTIRIFNLEPTKRKNLVYNLLQQEFGTGPLVQLTAGYKERNGLIFNGALTRGYTIREVSSGDWVTHMQVGVPLSYGKKITIDPVPVNDNSLLNVLKSIVDKLLNQPDRIEIQKTPTYNENFSQAINDYLSAGNTINENIGYSGTTIQIFAEIQSRFNLFFYQDNNGFGVIAGKFTTSQNPQNPLVIPIGNQAPEWTLSKETGMIGSPVYTDTGAKTISYLRPDARMFQLIKVESDVLNKNISITDLVHRGDYFSDEWYSEIDGSNLNQQIRQ
jgi:hypothetical protein